RTARGPLSKGTAQVLEIDRYRRRGRTDVGRIRPARKAQTSSATTIKAPAADNSRPPRSLFGHRLVPRRATGGDVNDPNWTCCSISAAAGACGPAQTPGRWSALPDRPTQTV